MPALYQVTASIRERHDELLADEENKSAVIQEALDQYYSIDADTEEN